MPIKKTYRMSLFRMTFIIPFQTGNFNGVCKKDFEGYFKRYFRGIFLEDLGEGLGGELVGAGLEGTL